MSEILFLIIGFLAGFAVCLFGYYCELDNMTAKELRTELDEINAILNDIDELEVEDDEMELSPLDRATNRTHKS